MSVRSVKKFKVSRISMKRLTSPEEHERWMQAALRLAEKGRYYTSPNPMVGALLVKKGKLLSQGYHARFGGEHAEVAAIRNAKGKAKGATLYVTLEPCSSWGKTPPCVESVIKAGIQEVVIGSLDPNPQNHGKSIARLKKHGIRVMTGVLEKKVRQQNAAFFKFAQTGLPFVTLKMAQSLDGKIASFTGRSRWISSPPARLFVHELRSEQDAVLVGKNTLYLDDPFLSPRMPSPKRSSSKPWRVALDPACEVALKARIFQGDQLTFLAISEKRGMKKKRIFEGAEKPPVLLPLPEKKGRLDLGVLLRKLGDLGVAKLLVEGGGELAWSLLKEKQVDRAFWIVAPKLIGGRDAKTSVEGEGFPNPDKAVFFQWKTIKKLGSDLLFEIPLSPWSI